MKNFIYNHYHYFQKPHYFLLWLLGRLNNRTYPSRMACLGKDAFSSKFLINEQKLRIDLFLSILKNNVAPKYDPISPYIKRPDILPLIAQQTSLNALIREIKSAKYFLMDSYSELVDQKFTHREEGWFFCANYSDLEHSAAFQSRFSSEGLLPIEKLKGTYLEFFNEIWKLNPLIQIIYIHFPTLLDDRIQFQDRGQAILTAISEIEDPRLIDIRVPNEKVLPNTQAPYPYHFSPETAHEIQLQLKKRLTLLS